MAWQCQDPNRGRDGLRTIKKKLFIRMKSAKLKQQNILRTPFSWILEGINRAARFPRQITRQMSTNLDIYLSQRSHTMEFTPSRTIIAHTWETEEHMVDIFVLPSFRSTRRVQCIAQMSRKGRSRENTL